VSFPTQDRMQRLAADIVAITALSSRWAGAPPQRIANDVVASLFHLCDDLEFVGVRLRLPPARTVEARRAVEGVRVDWPDDEAPRLVASESEAVLPIGAMAHHGEILLVGRSGARLEHERLLGVIAANQLEAACVALDLERDVAQAHEKLAALGKLGALGQLVGGVAHEVRTPLTYAMNNLFAIESALRHAHGEATVETIRPQLREMEAALDRIHGIVLQLRKFAKQDVARQIEEDVRDLVRDALRLWRATHVGGPETRDDLRPTAPVLVDRGQLQQVVLNLVQNAADAAGPDGTVTVSSYEDGTDVVLLVADDGPGMSADVQAKLFQPFHTTKADGLGLGLSIVRGIVEAHRGSIRVDSAPGRGTRMQVRLPRAQRTAA